MKIEHIKICGTHKAVLTGKFIALYSYIRKKENFQTSNLSYCLKNLKKEQINLNQQNEGNNEDSIRKK